MFFNFFRFSIWTKFPPTSGVVVVVGGGEGMARIYIPGLSIKCKNFITYEIFRISVEYPRVSGYPLNLAEKLKVHPVESFKYPKEG